MTSPAIVRVSLECAPEHLDGFLSRYRAQQWTIQSEFREPAWTGDRWVVGFEAVRCEEEG